MTRDIVLKCPVCLGRCKDDHGIECKPCGGKGVLWGKETDGLAPWYPMIPFWYPVYPSMPVGPTWVGDGITWTSTTTGATLTRTSTYTTS